MDVIGDLVSDVPDVLDRRLARRVGQPQRLEVLVMLGDDLLSGRARARMMLAAHEALAWRNRRRRYDAPTRLRLQLLDGYRAQIKALDGQERQVLAHLEELVRQSASTLGELCGLSTRSVAELLVEVGDPRRFTEGGFARFNGSAPLPASTAEGPGEPVRHRYNPGGNRRINAILYRMAITQLRCEPRAQRIYAGARANGHTKKEARRILKRHLSDVIYRRMIRDLAAADHASLSAQPLLAA